MNARITPPTRPTIRDLARTAGVFQTLIETKLQPGTPAWIAAMWFEARCHDRISELQREFARRQR